MNIAQTDLPIQRMSVVETEYCSSPHCVTNALKTYFHRRQSHFLTGPLQASYLLATFAHPCASSRYNALVYGPKPNPLPIEQRPTFVRGDCDGGSDRVMGELEEINQAYLFKLNGKP